MLEAFKNPRKLRRKEPNTEPAEVVKGVVEAQIAGRYHYEELDTLELRFDNVGRSWFSLNAKPVWRPFRGQLKSIEEIGRLASEDEVDEFYTFNVDWVKL